MAIFQNPYYLVAFLVLAAVSSFFFYKAFKEKDAVAGFYGLGIGMPTFQIDNSAMWVVGAVLVGLAYWIRQRAA